MKDDTAPDRAEVRRLLARVNLAWRSLRGEALRGALNSCFAEQATMRGPGFALLGKDRNFTVQSYLDFVEKCEVTRFFLEEPEIDIAGMAAVAQYKWKIAYRMVGADKEFTEEGRDLFVFSRETGKWQAVWRAVLQDDRSSA